MTLTFGSLRITLKIERLARFVPQIDQAQRKAEAEAIIGSEYYRNLKAQAQAYRAERHNMSETQKLRITHKVWVISTAIFIASLFIRTFDVRFEHFEDGSGHITYCVPGSICND